MPGAGHWRAMCEASARMVHFPNPSDTMPALRLFAVAALLLTAACSRGGRKSARDLAPATTARVQLHNVGGGSVGEATLQQTPAGVLLTADLSGLPAGTHGIHVHAIGRCEPDFAAAGPHFNPGIRAHGARNPAGKHAGDLTNIHVPESGALRVELLMPDVALSGGPSELLDADGASLVVHALADDYSTDPAGGSGARIACGVVR